MRGQANQHDHAALALLVLGTTREFSEQQIPWQFTYSCASATDNNVGESK